MPVIGRLFTMACAVGDLVRANSAFLARYSGVVPWIVAAPVLVPVAATVAVPMIKGAAVTKAAAWSIAPLVR